MPATWNGVPRDWVAGELVTATIGNQEWRDRMMYLKDAPVFDGLVTFTTGITGNLAVDTTTLFVDATNNRVGIGTITPSSDLNLHSTGNTKVLIHSTSSSGLPNLTITTSTAGLARTGSITMHGGLAANPDELWIEAIGGTPAIVLGPGAERFRVNNAGAVVTGTLNVSGISTFSTDMIAPQEIYRSLDTGFLRLAGGNAGGGGANIALFGSTAGAGNANKGQLNASAGWNITGDFLPTDATYDLGKSGATRFRDAFFSRNFVAGGTATIGGLVTFSSYTAATFVAGDKYLVVSATGVIHVSALGPAS